MRWYIIGYGSPNDGSCKSPINFWGDALLTGAYVINRVLSKSATSIKYELWTCINRNWLLDTMKDCMLCSYDITTL